MRRLCSIVLALAVFSNSVRMDELLKVPQLLKHYFGHKALHPETTPRNFFYEHYLVQQPVSHTLDQKEHDRLPFHAAQHPVQTFIVFFQGTFTTDVFTFYCRELILPMLEYLIPFRSGEIWQPPQLV